MAEVTPAAVTAVAAVTSAAECIPAQVPVDSDPAVECTPVQAE